MDIQRYVDIHMDTGMDTDKGRHAGTRTQTCSLGQECRCIDRDTEMDTDAHLWTPMEMDTGRETWIQTHGHRQIH